MASENRCPKCEVCGGPLQWVGIPLVDGPMGWVCASIECGKDCRIKELERQLEEAKAANKVQWDRGYYCAVAVLLKECGDDGSTKSVFVQGGDPSNADPEDKEVFIEIGWMEASK